MLHDFPEIPRRIPHNAPVACRVVQYGGNNRYAVALCMVNFRKTHQGFPLHQRRISVQDQHVLIILYKICRHHDRMPCTLLLLLQHELHTAARNARLHFFRFMPNHNADCLRTTAPRRFNHIIQHGFIQYFMQNLWCFRFHTGTFARRQHDCFQVFHSISFRFYGMFPRSLYTRLFSHFCGTNSICGFTKIRAFPNAFSNKCLNYS